MHSQVVLYLWSKFGDLSLKKVTNYHADKLVIATRTDTDAGNDDTLRLKLISVNKRNMYHKCVGILIFSPWHVSQTWQFATLLGLNCWNADTFGSIFEQDHLLMLLSHCHPGFYKNLGR